MVDIHICDKERIKEKSKKHNLNFIVVTIGKNINEESFVNNFSSGKLRSFIKIKTQEGSTIVQNEDIKKLICILDDFKNDFELKNVDEILIYCDNSFKYSSAFGKVIGKYLGIDTSFIDNAKKIGNDFMSFEKLYNPDEKLLKKLNQYFC